MKQGFLSPGLAYPFSTSAWTDTVDLDGKSNISLVMNGLKWFLVKFAPQIVAFRGLEGSFPIAPVFQPSHEAGRQCPVSDGFAGVLIGDRLVLEPSSYIEDTQTEVSHRHTTGEKGCLA